MGRGTAVTPRKRAIIRQYTLDGLNATQIAAKIGIARRTVADIVHKLSVSGSVDIGKSTGRPRITSKRDDIMMRRSVIKNPTLSSLEVKVINHVMASTRTIRRRLLQDFGLKACRPARKPLLNERQRRKRLNFCKKYQHLSEEDWLDVLFSDESTFGQFGGFTHLVRRPPGERFNPRFTIPTVKHPPKIMVWGSFSGRGRGSLYFVPQGTTVTAAVYLNIIKEKLVRTMNLHRCSTFQHDSAPAHAARVVQTWFKDNRIKVLEWPGNSPDLNPIENLWMLLKRKVRNYRPNNMQDLIFYIKRVWCMEVTPELCKKLVCSMPRRLKAVIANKGHATKY
jgi:transposase